MEPKFPLTLTIPRIPPGLNALRREYRNPHVYKVLRMAWETELLCAAGVPMLQAVREFVSASDTELPKRMRVQIHVRRRVLLEDMDNLVGGAKPVLDAIKNMGLIYDDSTKFIDYQITQALAGGAGERTMITIQPAKEI